jgi:hypothetical protein
MPGPHALHPELHAPTKRSRTTDVVRAAVNAGRPLPLAVMLENMWRYRDEAQRLEAARSGDPGYDPSLARACRLAAQKCAVDAARFVHPKLANVAIRPEDEDADRKAAARVTVDSLRGRSVTELGRMFLQIAKGEDLEEASPLATYENRDDAKTSSSLDNRAKDDTTTPNETPPEELI